MAKKLYNVEVTVPMVVYADGRESAENVARDHAREEISNCGSFNLAAQVLNVIRCAEDIEEPWEADAIPYTADGDPRTIAEILAAPEE